MLRLVRNDLPKHSKYSKINLKIIIIDSFRDVLVFFGKFVVNIIFGIV